MTKENNLIIFKQFVDENEIVETNIDEFIEHTELDGYYKKNSVIKILKELGIVRTPFAYYTTIKK